MTRFTAPAEEAPHRGTWMCWPSRMEIYTYDGRPSGYGDEVMQTIGRLAAAIAEHEPVFMCAPAHLHSLARDHCGDQVTLLAIDTDDMWARDTGPVFVAGDNGRAGVTFNFNAWGGKMDLPVDATLARRVLGHQNIPEITAGITGEGGGIEYDGDGTLLLTESCWVNDNRNPGLTRDQIECELRRVLGVEQVIWLQGVAGAEETDGHIDGYVRFIRPGLVMMSGAGRDDPNWGGDTIWHRDYDDAKARLQQAHDAKGRKLEIVELPWATQCRSDDARFFTSYANFYVGNGAVYSPQFGDDAADARAEATLRDLFPERKIVMLDVDRIYENGGGIHCVTQQEPA